MPKDEDVLGVCVGSSWVAVATDRRNLRIFSTSGIQRDIISIPGPVVCVAGFEDKLFLIYHSGMGKIIWILIIMDTFFNKPMFKLSLSD